MLQNKFHKIGGINICVLENKLYSIDLEQCLDKGLPWGKLDGKSVLITGATGLIGSFLVDLLMYRNRTLHSNTIVYAMGRNEEIAKVRFNTFWDSRDFCFLKHDVSVPLDSKTVFDYVIHAASNSNPILYAKDPVGTMLSNFLGIYYLLEHQRHYNPAGRILYVSSGEVYGQALEAIGSFDENHSGYVDSMQPRSCYPSSKRASETLLASYVSQYAMDAVVVRPCHIYGPTMTLSDTRAVSQFITLGSQSKDIILKSKGEQIRSYCYVADCVSAMLTVLIHGNKGETYNIANSNSVASIYELANIVANLCNVQVKFELPDEMEQRGFTPIKYGVLDATKLEQLGWCAEIGMLEGFRRTIEIIRHSKTVR